MSDKTGFIPTTVIVQEAAYKPTCLEWFVTIVGIIAVFGVMLLWR